MQSKGEMTEKTKRKYTRYPTPEAAKEARKAVSKEGVGMSSAEM